MSGFSVERSLIRLRVREHANYVSLGDTVLATGRAGFIEGEEEGLYVRQTRLISRYRCLLGRRKPHPVTSSNVRQDSWMGYYIAPAPGENSAADGDLVSKAAQQTIELRVSRWVGEGMREELVLTNYTQDVVELRLTLDLDADFADIEETRGERNQHGTITGSWRRRDPDTWELGFDYSASRRVQRQGRRETLTFKAGVALRIIPDSPPKRGGGKIHFDVVLNAKQTWRARLEWVASFDDEELPLPPKDSELDGANATHIPQSAFLQNATDFEVLQSRTLASVVDDAVHRARLDIAALRLYRFDRSDDAWTVAAGLPAYVALFGRDTLTTAQQTSLLGPELLNGTLPLMAELQGRRDDPWRDEQPGRILHEAHPGPLACLQYKPKDRYYGTLTGPGLFCTALAHLWQWTGDRRRIEPLLNPALLALRWLDEQSCDSKHGFYAVKTRSRDGLKNQTWKDSEDGIVEEDGRVVEHPAATCEEQGQVYAAKLGMAQLLDAFERRGEAGRLRDEANRLKDRFDDTYWMADVGAFAMAIAPDGHLVRSVGSNALRCVGSGIVARERIPALMKRLFAEDLFSGWGIRTLSSQHPAYNPYAYHRGTVWPVEHSPFVQGCYRYGAHYHVEQLCKAQFEAAAAFDYRRLPECFSGHARDALHPFPATYPASNSPQAWSASAVLTYVQSLLGLQPIAPLGVLLVDPHLPDWLPAIAVHHLRVGEARVSLRFQRGEDGHSHFDVIELRGTLRVLAAASPWEDVLASGAELREKFG